MIFFREQRSLIKFRENPADNPQGFFMRIRADFRGPVEPESGMILNLVTVDQGLQEALLQNSETSDLKSLLLGISKALQTRFSNQFHSVTVKCPSFSLTLESGKWFYQYRTRSWFQLDFGWAQRRVVLTSSQPISRKWRRSFKVQRWSHFDECVKALKNLKGPLIDVQIERPEWGGWERWYFEEQN